MSHEETKIAVKPSSIDILCGRGRAYANHPGNQNFAKIIQANLQKYKDSPKRIDRSIFLGSLVERIMDQGVRFLKKDKATKTWFELPVEQCHEKVGHALRDLMRKTQDSNDHNSQSRATIAMHNIAQNDYAKHETNALHEMNLNRFLMNQMRASFSEIAGNDRESIRSWNEQLETSGSSALLRLIEQALFDDVNDLESDEMDSLIFHSSATFNVLSDRPDLTQEPSFRNFDF